MKKIAVMLAAMALAVSAQAIDDNLADGYARIYQRLAIDDNLAGGFSVVGSSLWAGPFGNFWREWWGNATASFGGFTPVPRWQPNGGGGGGRMPGRLP